MDRDQIASLFKAYDIRGVAPGELSPEIAYKIGRALVVGPERAAVDGDDRGAAAVGRLDGEEVRAVGGGDTAETQAIGRHVHRSRAADEPADRWRGG